MLGNKSCRIGCLSEVWSFAWLLALGVSHVGLVWKALFLYGRSFEFVSLSRRISPPFEDIFIVKLAGELLTAADVSTG